MLHINEYLVLIDGKYQYKVKILDSTHCACMPIEYSREYGIPYHIAQLDSSWIEALSEKGVLKDSKRSFRYLEETK